MLTDCRKIFFKLRNDVLMFIVYKMTDINVLDAKLPFDVAGLFWSFMELVAIISIIGS